MFTSPSSLQVVGMSWLGEKAAAATSPTSRRGKPAPRGAVAGAPGGRGPGIDGQTHPATLQIHANIQCVYFLQGADAIGHVVAKVDSIKVNLAALTFPEKSLDASKNQRHVAETSGRTDPCSPPIAKLAGGGGP